MYNSRILALTIFAICAPTIAQAQTIAEKITKWGLVGSWSAVDCSARVTDSRSGRLIYQIRRGKPLHFRDFGKDGKDEAVISRANLDPDGSLEIRIEYKGDIGPRDITYIRAPDGRIRAKEHRLANGTYVIRDTEFVSNKAPSVWQTRCE